jgi:integrase/recombinase XerC
LKPNEEELAILDRLGKQRKPLPGQAEPGLLPTQKHAAIGAARAFRSHRTANAQGEMGCGKTTIGMGVIELLDAYPAIVICPPHLVPKWLDKKQRAALLRWVDKEVEDAMHRYPRLRLIYLRDAAIVKLILFAGLLVGEIVQLRMTDIILDERKGNVIVREGKETKRREIPLNVKARKAMLDYLQVRPDVENDSLFLGQRNEAIKSKTVQRSVSRFTGVAGLNEVTPHTLRHTFAKSLIDSGVSLDKVATLLGYCNLNTTRIYTTAGVQDLEDAVKELE